MSSRARISHDHDPIAPVLRQSGVLLGAIVMAVLGSEGGPGSGLVAMTVSIWVLFDLILLAFSRRWSLGERVREQGDLAFCLFLVLMTGGPGSIFGPILLITVLFSSTRSGLRNSILMASVSSIAIGAITVMEMSGWTSFPASGSIDLANVVPRLLSLALALHVVAFLGSRLAGRWKSVQRLNERIIDGLSEGIVVLDDEGGIQLANTAALQVLGFPDRSTWLGLQPADVFRRDTDLDLRRTLESPKEGSRTIEFRLRRGDPISLAVRTRKIPGDSRGAGFWLVVIRDRTLEAKVARNEARIQHLEELEDLALGLAHEIRNPLASLRGCVQEMARGQLSGEQVEQMQNIVLRDADRLDRTVDQFLEYSRTRKTEEAQSVCVARVARDVIETVRQRGDASEIALDFENLSDRPLLVRSSEDLVNRILLNLLINAVEACNPGCRVSISAKHCDDGGVEIVVRDDGSGMTPEVKARAFNPFFTTKTREGGLGLALVRKVVEGAGGSIDLESEPGMGTSFRWWIPGCNGEIATAEQKLQAYRGVTS